MIDDSEHLKRDPGPLVIPAILVPLATGGDIGSDRPASIRGLFRSSCRCRHERRCVGGENRLVLGHILRLLFHVVTERGGNNLLVGDVAISSRIQRGVGSGAARRDRWRVPEPWVERWRSRPVAARRPRARKASPRVTTLATRFMPRWWAGKQNSSRNR
jgi:hypothetical protein